MLQSCARSRPRAAASGGIQACAATKAGSGEQHLGFGESAMKSKVPAKNVKLKRVYDEPAAADGVRILVDRLWPRGVKKQTAAIDLWVKDLAPSTELRKWFGHETARWTEFERRYAVEVRQHVDLLDVIRKLAQRGIVTLIYAARDQEHNEAVIIRDMVVGSL
jgi:uncharacterized protein YeaO (DUF488 family)